VAFPPAAARTARLAWPLPALVAWSAAWALFLAARAAGVGPAGAACGAALLGAACALVERAPWRRAAIVAGFPLSFAALGFGGSLPAWSWLALLAALGLAYPRRAWRDAPLYPTPPGALRGVAAVVVLPPSARILDAGCGLGAGLAELRRAWPRATLHGVEWSWPLVLLCVLRRRDARIARGDMWRTDWSSYDLVYLFQRPESMARAIEKARREMRPGSWLASLEFEATDLRPQHRLVGADGRPLWLYRLPFAADRRRSARD
jgi:SAM-dependent methyltransferase